MNIAIIGGTGLLGSNLVKLYSYYNVRAFSREQSYNINSAKNTTIDFNYLECELIKYFDTWRPDIIINTVANVNLQRCEDSFESANKINCDIAIKLSIISKKYSSYFVHISTDHFFNDKSCFHNEEHPTVLLNNYAKTKYNAETGVKKHNKKSLIVRTNIIGFRGRTEKSFFEWLLVALKEGEKINLYDNFYTSPISVNELGVVIIKCYQKKLTGIYNIASCEVISKYDFGIKMTNKFGYSAGGISKSKVNNGAGSELKRALTLGLDVSKIENNLDIKMPTIDQTLDVLYKEYIKHDE